MSELRPCGGSGTLRPDRVEVAWQDAARTDGWRSLKAILDERPARVYSLGYLVKNTPEYITIVQSMDDSEGAADALTIPAPWVCEIVLLGIDGTSIIKIGQPKEGACRDHQNTPCCQASACTCRCATT